MIPVGVCVHLLRGDMSADGTTLLFEGFLQKRKDNLVSGKLSWS